METEEVFGSDVTAKGWQIPPSVWMSHSHHYIPTVDRIQVYRRASWPVMNIVFPTN